MRVVGSSSRLLHLLHYQLKLLAAECSLLSTHICGLFQKSPAWSYSNEHSYIYIYIYMCVCELSPVFSEASFQPGGLALSNNTYGLSHKLYSQIMAIWPCFFPPISNQTRGNGHAIFVQQASVGCLTGTTTMP